MRSFGHWIRLLPIAASLLASGGLHAQVRYELSLVHRPDEAPFPRATAISPSGNFMVGLGGTGFEWDFESQAVRAIANGSPYSVNDAGMAVGDFLGRHGLYAPGKWVHGVHTRLPVWRGGGHARGVNNSGVVVGGLVTYFGTEVPVVWIDDQYQRLPLGKFNQCYALNINDRNQVAGCCDERKLVVWDLSTWTLTPLGEPPRVSRRPAGLSQAATEVA